MHAYMPYSHTADPSYIIDVLVSVELQMLEAKGWCGPDTMGEYFFFQCFIRVEWLILINSPSTDSVYIYHANAVAQVGAILHQWVWNSIMAEEMSYRVGSNCFSLIIVDFVQQILHLNHCDSSVQEQCINISSCCC